MRFAAAPRLRSTGWPAAGQRAAVIVLAVLVTLLVAGLLHGTGAGVPRAVPNATVPASAGGLEGQATWAAGTRPAPPITLRDQSGRHFALSELRGHPVVVTFWDSHCTQECPLAGRALAAAEASVPSVQRPVNVIVSVNPLDTRASVRSAMRRWGLAGLSPWHWLMGARRSLAAVWRDYRIVVMPTRTDIVHTEAIYLLDRRGDERSGFLYPYLPQRVAADLRTVASARDRGT